MKLQDLKPEDPDIVDNTDDIDAESMPSYFGAYSCWEESIYDEISGPLKNILEMLKPSSEEFKYLMAWYFQALDQYPKDLNAREKMKKQDARIGKYQDDIDHRQLKRKQYYEDEAEDKTERNDIIRKIDNDYRAITKPNEIRISIVLDKINDALYKSGINKISKSTYDRIREK